MKIYSDGSTPLKNPSPVGITWAFVVVDEDDSTIIHQQSGFISKENCKGFKASNNLAEMIAAIKGIEYVNNTLGVVKQDAGVTFYSDSELTINRLFKSYSMAKLPRNVHERALALNLHNITPVLLAGHPTKKNLADGFLERKGRRFPVSKYNVLCDKMCADAALPYIKVTKLPDEASEHVTTKTLS